MKFICNTKALKLATETLAKLISGKKDQTQTVSLFAQDNCLFLKVNITAEPISQIITVVYKIHGKNDLKVITEGYISVDIDNLVNALTLAKGKFIKINLNNKFLYIKYAKGNKVAISAYVKPEYAVTQKFGLDTKYVIDIDDFNELKENINTATSSINADLKFVDSNLLLRVKNDVMEIIGTNRRILTKVLHVIPVNTFDNEELLIPPTFIKILNKLTPKSVKTKSCILKFDAHNISLEFNDIIMTTILVNSPNYPNYDAVLDLISVAELDINTETLRNTLKKLKKTTDSEKYIQFHIDKHDISDVQMWIYDEENKYQSNDFGVNYYKKFFDFTGKVSVQEVRENKSKESDNDTLKLEMFLCHLQDILKVYKMTTITFELLSLDKPDKEIYAIRIKQGESIKHIIIADMI